MAIDATPGGINANSFATEDAANDYVIYEREYAADFLAASSSTKEKVLRMATKELDAMNWKGTIVDTTTPQALRWPRSGVYSLDGVELASDEIPLWLERATIELAISLFQKNRYDDPETQGLRKVTAGEVAVSFDRKDRPTRNPTTVNQMIAPYLVGGSTGNFTYNVRA